KKILIIEDEIGMLTALSDNLTAAGFGQVIKARDGKEGLELALRELPDLILLDLVLPKMDGMPLLSKLRENEAGKNIKVILLTNLNADDSIMTGIVKNDPSFYMVKAEHSVADVIEKVKETL